MSKDEEQNEDLQEQLLSLQEAHESLESERNELNRKAEALETELCEVRDQLKATKSELEDCICNTEELTNPEAIALLFLEKNCSKYTINKDNKVGSIVVSGTLEGEQAGYVTRFVPRVFRSNGKAPYLIHEEDTYKQYRSIDFKYSSLGETLAQAVEGIIALYCPGDVEVGRQAFEDNRYCDYGDGVHTWVQCATEETLEEVQALKEVGEDADLTNPNVRHSKVPGR